ncbi:MAG: hypothetical protein M1839_004610 [Geoglossum umbratile]|nr:MAG: hypothetical protein M1839_004610 [Geoglossum umbratile]
MGGQSNVLNPEENVAVPTKEQVILFCADKQPPLAAYSDDIAIKFGMAVAKEEYNNQAYAYENRNGFEVPRVHAFYEDENRGYIVMQFIKGFTLDERPDEYPQHIHNITTAILNLHSIRVPSNAIPGPVGAPGEPRVPQGYLWGECTAGRSFKSAAEMETWLNRRLQVHESSRANDKISITGFPLQFCHGDIAPWNVMILDTGKICLVDWAFAGFYPYFFEIFALRISWEHKEKEAAFFPPILKKLLSLQQYEELQVPLLKTVYFVNARYGGRLNRKEEEEQHHAQAEAQKNTE